MGTRRDDPFPGEPASGASPVARPPTKKGKSVAERQRSSREPNDQPLPRDPVEQRSDTWAREAERSTGVSGHMSAD
ncbi:hypothetical protein DB354_14160 [Opitutus sp. ER46]|nr:hypothetical protein DB354_14160 [Opitutus sp. ER46]